MLQSTLISWILISRNISLYSVIQIFAGLTVAAFAVFSLAYRVLYTEGISAQKLDNSPPKLLLPVGEIASSFFGNTFDFFNNGFKATSSSIFQFRLFRHDVIALSGDEGRHAFFQEKGLDLYHGFQIIIGTVRRLCSLAIPSIDSYIFTTLSRFLPDLARTSSTASTDE